ncbi:MAG TPA: aldo/keto reductase, partial [Terracidiphilus sp.]|nr:aldo/keto reductase [Terracidiphilus sp.]
GRSLGIFFLERVPEGLRKTLMLSGFRARGPPLTLPDAGYLHPAAACRIQSCMEYRLLGGSGLKVPALSFGTGTFGGSNDFFKAWGSTDVEEARRLIDICLEAGVNLFDTADIYSDGHSEEVLGKALDGKRDRALISTKTTFRLGDGPNDVGSSRYHLRRALEASLRRLGTDYVDIYHLHGFDALTPVEEVQDTLNTFVREGKVRYIAASNFSGWHLMKSLAVAERYGWTRFVAHQVYYSLIGREYEWELMPLGLDQKVGALVWSPLGWGRLTGKIRRGQPLPEVSRLHKTAEMGPQVSDEHLYKVVDALDAVAAETGKTVPQVALNWLLQRPTVSSVIFGARTEEQLRQNLGAVGWNLTAEQVVTLDKASATQPVYPYWHQRQFSERNPLPV